jgi:hypothetical protein
MKRMQICCTCDNQQLLACNIRCCPLCVPSTAPEEKLCTPACGAQAKVTAIVTKAWLHTRAMICIVALADSRCGPATLRLNYGIKLKSDVANHHQPGPRPPTQTRAAHTQSQSGPSWLVRSSFVTAFSHAILCTVHQCVGPAGAQSA